MIRIIVASLLAIVSAEALATGDVAAGKSKAIACVGCHGVNGKAMAPNFPSLAGQNAGYLEGVLKAYKSKERKGYQAAIMYGMAAGLSDEDIVNISAYYSSLK